MSEVVSDVIVGPPCCQRFVYMVRQQLVMDTRAHRYCRACGCSCITLVMIAMYLLVSEFDKVLHKLDIAKIENFKSNSAELAGEDSGTRVAARISRLGTITIDVATTMQIDVNSGFVEAINRENLGLWQYYQDKAERLRERVKVINGELTKSQIAKTSGAILKEAFQNEVANTENADAPFYLPSPLRNQIDKNDSKDYFEYFFMDESAYKKELVEILDWRNPSPIKPKPMPNAWATMQRKLEWNIWSAVPSASSLSGNQGPMLALIGEDTQKDWHPGDPRDIPYQAVVNTRHSVIFPSGEIKVFKKYRRQPGQGGNTMTWFADLPPADEIAWMYPPRETQHACLTFGILDAFENLLKNFTSCHNPSTLPPAGAQYGFTLCYSIPPMHDPDKKEYSGYLALPQSIMYHIRHGVDQVVVYLGAHHREHALALLKPFITRRKITIVFLESQSKPHHAINNETSDKDYRMYDLGGALVFVEHYLHNDCVNRFRGRSQFIANMGFDEFIYAPRWRMLPHWAASSMSLQDELQPLLSYGCADDYNAAISYTWLKPDDPSRELLLSSTEHYEDQRRGYTIKSLIKPGCVASVWTHFPADCFGTRCSEFQKPLLEFAHIRATRNEEIEYMGKEQEDPDNKTVVSDSLFVDELALLRPELCRWMREAGFGCQPGQWLPQS